MRKLALIVIVVLLLLTFGNVGFTADEKELEYWCYWDEGHPNDILMQEIVQAFESETGIKVNYSNAGRDILNKIRPALLDGNPPDLFDGHGIEMWPALIRDDLLLNLEDLYTGNGYGADANVKFEEVFIPGSDKQWAKDGIRHYVPYTDSTSVVWYNKKLFSELGLTPPKTMEELSVICDKVKEAGIAPFSQDGGIFYDGYFFYWLSQRINGPGVFLAASLDPTGAKWDDPGLLEAAKWTAKFTTEKWLISNAESNTWPAGQIDFVQGKGAMLLCGSWVPNETFDKTSPDFEFGAFAFPMVEGGKGDPNSVEMETIGWGIPKDAKNPDLAKEFIRFAMQEEYQKKWFSVLYPPARQGLQEFAPPELKDVIDIVSNSTAYHTMFDGVQAEAEYWSKVFLPLNQELLYGRLAPEDFISQIKDETVKFYNK